MAKKERAYSRFKGREDAMAFLRGMFASKGRIDWKDPLAKDARLTLGASAQQVEQTVRKEVEAMQSAEKARIAAEEAKRKALEERKAAEEAELQRLIEEEAKEKRAAALERQRAERNAALRERLPQMKAEHQIAFTQNVRVEDLAALRKMSEQSIAEQVKAGAISPQESDKMLSAAKKFWQRAREESLRSEDAKVHNLFVIRSRGKPIGYARFGLSYTPQRECVMHLMDAFIKPEYSSRGEFRGLGTMTRFFKSVIFELTSGVAAKNMSIKYITFPSHLGSKAGKRVSVLMPVATSADEWKALREGRMLRRSMGAKVLRLRHRSPK